MDNTAISQPNRSTVLTRAVQRAARLLGLSPEQPAAILGTSESIRWPSTEGELAVLFLRAFRHLDVLFGGNSERCRQWLHAPNRHLDGFPVELLASVLGLVRVNDYLAQMRQPFYDPST